MSFKVNIFPAKLSWPDAIDNLYKADSNEKIVRLVANPKNFDLLMKFQGVKRLWCFDINEKHLEIICNCKSIEQLYIENLKTDKLSKLGNLPELKILSLLCRHCPSGC